MEQQIQKEKRMGQNEVVKIADYINLQKLRVLRNTTPGRIADSWSMCAGCGKGYPENLSHGKQNRWHARLALGDGQNSKNYWT